MPEPEKAPRTAVAATEEDILVEVGAADAGADMETQELADPHAEIERLTDRMKRALADAENARKRANAAHAEGCTDGVALAVAALVPAFDALLSGIEAARASPDADDPGLVHHLEGLRNIRSVFEAALKALGVRIIAPQNTPFDPVFHEALGAEVADDMPPGQVLVLHRPGFGFGNRLIRPAQVTVSAAPGEGTEDWP